MKFSELLQKLRKEKAMTQADLAEKLDVTDKTISKWETGASFPETAQLVPLSEIFSVTVDELLKGEVKKTTEKPIEKTLTEKPNHYAHLDKHETVIVAIAVPLMLLGVIALTLMASLSVSFGIYVPVLLVFVSIAVGMLSNMGMKKTVKPVEEKSKDINLYIGFISTGVSILIFSPSAIVSMLAYGVSYGIYLSVFFAVVAIALIFLIIGGINFGNFAYKHVKEITSEFKGTGEEYIYFTNARREKINGAVCGCIMMIATTIYLIFGLSLGLWHPTWVVFVVGGLLCGMVNLILGVSDKNTSDKNTTDKNNDK